MDWCENLPCWTVFLNNVELITRVWGIFTSIVLFGIGVDLWSIHQLAGGFGIAAAFITLFLETSWAVTILLQVCLRYDQHPLYICWDAVTWIEYWKRTVIYTTLAVLLFAQPHRAWFSTVGGLILITLGLLHAARWYRALKNDQLSLLEQQEIGGIDDDVGDIDLSLPEPVIHHPDNSSAPGHSGHLENQLLNIVT